jgi:anti-anti-sigma regulatory factor
MGLALIAGVRANAVLKISILDDPGQRRLVLEGKLIAPWAAELRSVCGKSEADSDDHELVIDVKNVTAISEDGEVVLLELMNQGAKFCCGVFTKHVLKQLARRTHQKFRETKR